MNSGKTCSRRLRNWVTLAVLIPIAVVPAEAYIRSTFTFGDGVVFPVTVVPVKRSDADKLQFYVNNKIAPNLQGTGGTTVISPNSDPIFAIRAALASWNTVSTSTVHFLPLKSTDKVIDSKDGQHTIALGSTVEDISALGSALAITVNTGQAFTLGGSPTGDISDSDIVLNPAVKFSTDGSTSVDLQGVMTHELGHALGSNHSGLLGATMFQFASLSGRFLSQDEVSFITAVYPAKTAGYGTLSGKVIASDGSAVQAGLVSLIDVVSGAAQSALTAADGTYSQLVPAGSYIVTAEPLGPNSIVQPGNLYLTTATKVTTNFQASILGGPASPTKVAVTGGGTVSAPDLTVTSGVSTLQLPFAGIGAAGVSGDVGNVGSGNPIAISSGRSVDIALIGGGVDSSIAVYAFGQGVSVKAGSVRVDSKVSFGGSLAGQPLVRVTVDLAALQTRALTTLFITKGSNSYLLSGAFVAMPPKPAFTSKGVVSAASFKGLNGDGVVSPGGIYSIYDSATLSLGPTAFAQPASYDDYGNLSANLGGVTVTFDGVPAPLYLSYSGQLNMQVPFEVAGKTSTKVVVSFLGSSSDPVTVPVAAAQPSFFTFTAGGTDAIIQNFPDITLNTASTPLARGGIALIYGTGIGKLAYPLATGQPGVVPPSSYSSTHSCSFGGKTSSAYVYWNYGFVGEAIWTAAVPNDAPTGSVSFTCTDSATGTTTQTGSIFIR